MFISFSTLYLLHLVMWSMNSNQKDSAILSLKEFTLSEDSYYGAVLNELNDGQTAPFIYAGWETVVVPWGEKMIEYMRGKVNLDELIDYMDETQDLITDNAAETYTKVTETLDTEDCAKLIGIAFAQAADADAALVSENVYYYDQDAGTMNEKGVSGSLFPLPVTEQELVSILPTGWSDNSQTVTLTGARIKELAENGYEKLSIQLQSVEQQMKFRRKERFRTQVFLDWMQRKNILASLKHYPRKISSGSRLKDEKDRK